jgi:hypothetical protein
MKYGDKNEKSHDEKYPRCWANVDGDFCSCDGNVRINRLARQRAEY